MPRFFRNSQLILRIMTDMPLNINEYDETKQMTHVSFYHMSASFERMSQISLLHHIYVLHIYAPHPNIVLRGMKEFSQLRDLQLAYMNANQLPDMLPPSLTALTLKHISGLTYIPESIGSLPALETFKLKHLPHLEYLPIPHPDQMYLTLIKLKVSDCAAFKEFCEHTHLLPKLRFMVICGEKNGRNTISKLESMRFPPSLTHLKLRYLNVPYDDENRVRNCFPFGALSNNLEILRVSHCTVNALFTRYIPPNLRILVASHCNLSTIGNNFRTVSSLRMLNLSSNHLTNIPALPQSLQMIDISHNKLAVLDTDFFALSATIVRATDNQLRFLPVSYGKLSELAANAIEYDFNNNPLLLSVLMVINQSHAARANPSALYQLRQNWSSMTIGVSCDDSYNVEFTPPSESAVSNHLQHLTSGMENIFYNTYPNESISSTCMLCNGEFSRSAPPYVCNINASDIMYTICHDQLNPHSQQIMNVDVHHERISHYAHPMHLWCARQFLFSRFECPETHLKFYDQTMATSVRHLIERFDIQPEDLWEISKNQDVREISIEAFIPELNQPLWIDTNGNAISPMYVFQHWEDDDPTLTEHYTRVMYSNIDFPILVDPASQPMKVLDGLHRLICMLLSKINVVKYRDVTTDMITAYVARIGESRNTRQIRMFGKVDEKKRLPERSFEYDRSLSLLADMSQYQNNNDDNNQPISFTNENGICYLNCIIANLFYLQHIRQYIMNERVWKTRNTKVMKGLQQFLTYVSEHRQECNAEPLVALFNRYCPEIKIHGADLIYATKCIFRIISTMDANLAKISPVFVNLRLVHFFKQLERESDEAKSWIRFNMIQKLLNYSVDVMKTVRDASVICFEIDRNRYDLNTQEVVLGNLYAKNNIQRFFEHTHDTREFTFMNQIHIEDCSFSLYSIFIIETFTKQTPPVFGTLPYDTSVGHAFVFIRGKWKNDSGGIDEWMEFNDTLITPRSQQYVEDVAFSRMKIRESSYAYAAALFYVESSQYNSFTWSLK